MADHPQRPPTGGKRFRKFAGMTASVAGGYAKGKIKRLFLSEEEAEKARLEDLQRAGERIVETLGELKGAAMKVGQMASLAADLLPEELQAPLRALQREAPPMDYEVIEEMIRAEFDQPVEMLFDSFEREPFASASIGQVHRATLDGQDLIVKVQYPGVDSAVDSDLRHLRFALKASGVLPVERKAIDRAFDEVRNRLHEELDYINESDNVRRFAAFHADHPYVVVPQVIGHRTAKRVLTLTYEPGDHVDEIDALEYTQEERDRCGAHLWRVMQAQIFDHECIHADPNPANFAFRRDGTIVMYDFGCVKDIPKYVQEGLHDAAIFGLEEDYDAIDRTMLALKVRKPGATPAPASFYKLWRDWLADPLLGSDPFDFATASFEKSAFSTLGPATLRYMTLFQPAEDLVFVNRMFGGLYAVMRKIRARVSIADELNLHHPDVAEHFFAAARARAEA